MIKLVALLSLISCTVEGLNFCDGLICPPRTGCSVSATEMNGTLYKRRSCTDYRGNVVLEKVTSGHVGASTSIMQVEGAMCYVSTDETGNTTKMCDDGKGNLEPMTPEQEKKFEEARQRALEAAKIQYEEGMKHMQQALETANRWKTMATKMAIEAHAHGMEIRQNAENYAQAMQENMKRMFDGMFGGKEQMLAEKVDRRQEAMERRLEEAERRRELRQEALERKLELAEAKRERLAEAHERRLDAIYNSADW